MDNNNINFTSADFLSGVYLLGEIPINGLVTSFCAFGTIQANGSENARGLLSIYIAREVSTGSMMVMDPYNINIMQRWNSSDIACRLPSPAPVVMESDKVYVYVPSTCNMNNCPLQVNYRSNEHVLNHADISRRDAVMGITKNSLNLVSTNMTSLNVRITIQGNTSESTPTTESQEFTLKAVVVSVPVVMVLGVITVILLLLVIAFVYKTMQKKSKGMMQ